MTTEPNIIPVGQEPPALPEATARPPMTRRRTPSTPSTPHRVPGADGGQGKGHGRANTRNRFAVLNAFVDYGARRVNPTAQACWWVVYRETKPDGLARVSHGRIAACIGVSRWTVVRAVQRLTRAGLLTVVRRGGLQGGSSIYRVHGTSSGVAGALHPP